MYIRLSASWLPTFGSKCFPHFLFPLGAPYFSQQSVGILCLIRIFRYIFGILHELHVLPLCVLPLDPLSNFS